MKPERYFVVVDPDGVIVHTTISLSPKEAVEEWLRTDGSMVWLANLGRGALTRKAVTIACCTRRRLKTWIRYAAMTGLKGKMMNPSQHIEAILKTVRVKNEVTANIFDDKVTAMGTVTVSNGKITIDLDCLPSMLDNKYTGEFLVASISLGIEACWKARREAFEKLS